MILLAFIVSVLGARWSAMASVKSPYTDLVLKVSQKSIPLAWSGAEARDAMQFRCIATEGDPFYIGIEQRMTINAPYENVVKIMSNVDGYQKLFPGYTQIKVVDRQGNHLRTFWEQRVPVFFVPNVKYEMDYVIESASAARTIYRYQLREKKDLQSSDGVILLEPLSGNRTQYYELDFYAADWGIAKSFGEKKIWRENVDGMLQSDLAVKIWAENPSLKPEKARDLAEGELDRLHQDRNCSNKVTAEAALGLKPTPMASAPPSTH